MNIDTASWDRITSQEALWYASEEIWPIIEKFFANPAEEMSSSDRELRDNVISYFAEKLAAGSLVLGSREEFFNDDDRWTPSGGWQLEITGVVIHHTAMKGGISYDRLNALQLLRLYCPLYKNSKAFQRDGELQPISSGHFLNGKQTFVGYHWGIPNSADSVAARLLDDRYTGFHAGNYGVNCRTVGIAIDDDLSDAIPTSAAIKEVRRIISMYPSIKRDQVIGHREVPGREGIVCPGDRWLEWKDQLLVDM